MRKVLSAYIYSNIHVALAASSVTIFSFLAIGISIDWNYIYFIFSSTLTLYILHGLVGLYKNKVDGFFERFQFVKQFKYIFGIAFLISASFSFYCFIFLQLSIRYLLIIPILISSIYTLPIINGKQLRDFPFIKIFLIAISWSIICTLIPIYQSSMNQTEIWVWTISTGLYVFAITIPFDIRDFEIDKKFGTITLPTKFGILPSIRFAHISLLISGILFLYLMKDDHINAIAGIAFLVSLLIAIPMVARTRPNSSEFYVSGWIEGLLMLPMFLYFLLDHLWSLF